MKKKKKAKTKTSKNISVSFSLWKAINMDKIVLIEADVFVFGWTGTN